MADKTDVKLECYKTKNAVALEREKAALQMFIELNKASVDSSFRAIRGAFLLNGGAATALLVTDIKLAAYACSFAFGSLVAVFAMGLAYSTNLAAADTWRPHIEHITTEEHAEIFNDFKNKLRYATCFAFLSGIIFFITLVILANNVIS